MKLKNSIIHTLKELGLLIGTLIFINLMGLFVIQFLPLGIQNIATGLLTISGIVLYLIGYILIHKGVENESNVE